MKFFALVAELPLLDFWHRVFARERRKFFNRRPQLRVRQIHDALAVAGDVFRGFCGAGEAHQGGPPERSKRRDRGQVGFAVFVERADKGDRSSEVQNLWFDGLETGFGHCFSLPSQK
jgi:hypothetical protein